MHSSSDIHDQGSEGLAAGAGSCESFNAVGSLASTLGQTVEQTVETANPSGLANPLPTGIPLSAGDIAVPQSPDNLRHGSAKRGTSVTQESQESTQKTRAQSPGLRNRRSPLRATSPAAPARTAAPSPTRPPVSLDATEGDTGMDSFLEPMTAARLNSIVSLLEPILRQDLSELRQKVHDLERQVATRLAVDSATTMDANTRHVELEDTVTRALVEFNKRFNQYDYNLNELIEKNVELEVKLAEAHSTLNDMREQPPVHRYNIATPEPQPPIVQNQAFPGCGPPQQPFCTYSDSCIGWRTFHSAPFDRSDSSTSDEVMADCCRSFAPSECSDAGTADATGTSDAGTSDASTSDAGTSDAWPYLDTACHVTWRCSPGHLECSLWGSVAIRLPSFGLWPGHVSPQECILQDFGED